MSIFLDIKSIFRDFLRCYVNFVGIKAFFRDTKSIS